MNIFHEILKELPKTDIKVIPHEEKDSGISLQMTALLNSPKAKKMMKKMMNKMIGKSTAREIAVGRKLIKTLRENYAVKNE